jgi:hypothetical protein
MYSELHRNLVAYKIEAGKRRYRQIAVVEKEQFEVRIFEGEVLQLEPQFAAKNSYAEVYLHPTLEAAITDAEKEFGEGSDGGWQPYHADRV